MRLLPPPATSRLRETGEGGQEGRREGEREGGWEGEREGGWEGES